MIDAAQLPGRLRALPGMERLLEALDGLGECFLVGGAVRDLLLGTPLVDVDIAVESDAQAFARELVERRGGSARAYDRFGTATLDVDGIRVDLARARRETYASPAALPDVEPAALAEDLGRRDFTINAMALRIVDGVAGEIEDPYDGRGDLERRLIRTLHPASFVDDPTRLLRAVRYAARLGFVLEEATERQARAAIADGAPATVSGPRIRAELVELLAEDEAPRAVELLSDLGLDRALHPALRADPELVAAAKLGALEVGADPVLTALAALCVDGPGELEAWVDRLGVGAAARAVALRAAHRAPVLSEELRRDLRPSQLHALLAPEPSEALALALGLGAPAGPVLDFVARLSGVRLEIDGGDLLAAGVSESPAIGRALEATLARKLDGEVQGREQELRCALELAGREA
jgi:tRNA nucleotidyltransferase (CCA-adding enzyme)